MITKVRNTAMDRVFVKIFRCRLSSVRLGGMMTFPDLLFVSYSLSNVCYDLDDFEDVNFPGIDMSDFYLDEVDDPTIKFNILKLLLKTSLRKTKKGKFASSRSFSLTENVGVNFMDVEYEMFILCDDHDIVNILKEDFNINYQAKFIDSEIGIIRRIMLMLDNCEDFCTTQISIDKEVASYGW